MNTTSARAESTTDRDPVAIVVAEDSEFDRLLLRDALEELQFHVNLTFVGDGEDLLAYLSRYKMIDGGDADLPALVLMDLNMPRMKGLDALRHLRSDSVLRMLPVIVLSTSNNPKQIAQAYAHGVNAYLTKPEGFEEYLMLLKRFGAFWLQSAQLPLLHTAC
jgi:two-component system response regulator